MASVSEELKSAHLSSEFRFESLHVAEDLLDSTALGELGERPMHSYWERKKEKQSKRLGAINWAGHGKESGIERRYSRETRYSLWSLVPYLDSEH